MKRAICIGVAIAALTTGGHRARSHRTSRVPRRPDDPRLRAGAQDARHLLRRLPQLARPCRRRGVRHTASGRRPRARRRLGSRRAQAARPADAAARKPQPDQREIDAFVAWMETTLDARRGQSAAVAGHVPMQRLTRTEYGTAVNDLLGIELDAEAAAAGRDRSRRLRQHRRGAERLARVPRSVRRRRAAGGAGWPSANRCPRSPAPTTPQPATATIRPPTSTGCRSARAAG